MIKKPQALVTFRRTTLLLLTVTLFLWPKYFVFAPSVSPFTLAVLVSFGVVLLLGFAGGLGGSIPSVGAGISIVLFSLFYGVRFGTDLNSVSVSESLYSDLRDFALSGMLFVISMILARYPNSLEQVARWICWCAIAIATVAFIERALAESLPRIILNYLPIKLDAQFLAMLTADNTRDLSFRAQGIFTHPIVLGEITAAMLPVAVSVFLDDRKKRMVPVLATMGCLLAVALSGSRAAMIALLVGITCQAGLLLITSRKQLIWATALISLPLLTLAAPIAFGKISGLAAGQSAAERLSSDIRDLQWERGMPALEKRPLFGHGAGRAVELAGVQGRFGVGLTIDDFYLSMLLDVGIVGTAIFALFILSLVVVVLSSNVSDRRRKISVGYLSGIVSIILCQKGVSLTEGMAYLYFFAGLLLAKEVRPIASRVPVRMVTPSVVRNRRVSTAAAVP